MPGPAQFQIIINSIDDFAKFLKVIRNEEIEAKGIQTAIDTLKASETKLQTAVETYNKEK